MPANRSKKELPDRDNTPPDYRGPAGLRAAQKEYDDARDLDTDCRRLDDDTGE